MAKTVLIENVKILGGGYRNFAGKIDEQFNKLGFRSFNISLEDMGIVDQMMADGWNIKRRPGQEEGDIDFCTLDIRVSYDKFTPSIKRLVEIPRGICRNCGLGLIEFEDHPDHCPNCRTPIFPGQYNVEIDKPLFQSTNLTKDTIDILDSADIVTADIAINPSHYNVAGRQGIKAYLQSMVVIVKEDPFANKYEVV